MSVVFVGGMEGILTRHYLYKISSTVLSLAAQPLPFYVIKKKVKDKEVADTEHDL